MEPGQDWKIAALTFNKCVCFFVGEIMEEYMLKTIKLCDKALKNNDIPVGCMILKDNKIISKSYNKKYLLHDSTAHAEILAIRKACKKLKTTHLDECTLYVTLEPCMMCTAAIIQSHIKKVVYCLKSPKYGYLLKEANKNKIECTQMYNEEYEKKLKNFFIDKR